MLSREKQEELMRLAILEAEKAAESGNEPFGAVLCDSDGNVILGCGNSEALEGNPIAHAETTLIRKACELLGTRDLSPYSIVCNAESCPMCTAALTLAGIRNFYCGAEMEPFCNPYLRMRDILSKTIWDVTLVEGVLKEECTAAIADARKKKAAADLSLTAAR